MAVASNPNSATETSKAIVGPLLLDLDPDNLANHQLAQDLSHNGSRDEFLAVRIVKHRPQISGSRHKHQDGGGRGENGEYQGCDSAVSAGRLDLALQAEPLPDDLPQAGQDLAQV